MILKISLIVIFGILLLFILTHIRPLNEHEINQLGNKRRGKQIRTYFSFDRREIGVDKEFKKRMNASGKFYPIRERLQTFPSVAAALLKYKKHEWNIIAFERNKEVFLIWCNKGLDRRSVTLNLSMENVARIAYEKGANSILFFHNHPNPDPGRYSTNRPSDQDLKSAKLYSTIYNSRGLNLVEFVCERGRHFEYFMSPANSFLPLTEFLEAINYINGSSRLSNLKLHIERIF